MHAVPARRLLLVLGLALTCLQLPGRPLGASSAPPQMTVGEVGPPPATMPAYYDPMTFWWRFIATDPSVLLGPNWGVTPVWVVLPDGSVVPVIGDQDLFDPRVWLPGHIGDSPSGPPLAGGSYPGGPPVYAPPSPSLPAYDWNWGINTLPEMPQGLRALRVTGGVHLNWEMNREPDIASYQLWRSDHPDTGYALLVQTGLNFHFDTTARPGKNYWYIVAAVDMLGYISDFTPPVSPDTEAPPQAPAAPRDLRASARPVEVALTWKAPGGSPISGYHIERGDGGTGSWASIGTSESPAFTDRSVQVGATYQYRVRAFDEEGRISDPSNEVVATVPAPRDEPPAPPADDTPPPPPTGDALNVLDFGANVARDGDDTHAIQKAFHAARERNRDVYFPAGHYRISQKLVFRATGRTIFGDGWDRSTLAGNTDRHTLIELLRTNAVTVRDLRFEGSLTNEQNTNIWPAIECASTTGTKLFRNHSYGTGYLVRDSGGTGTFVQGNVCEDYGRIGYLIGSGAVVKDNRFVCRPTWQFEDQMNGIYASAGKANLLIENNEFIHCGSYAMTLWGSNTGVWTENITVQQNIFEDCDRVLVVASSASGPGYRNVKFLNNTVRRSGDKSIHIGKFNGSNAEGTGLVIDGNVFEDPGSDMSIFITNWNRSGPITGVRISNNQFLHPGKSPVHGIYVWQNGAELSDIVIENNLFADFGHNGSTEKAHSAIYLRSARNLQIRENIFHHWRNGSQAVTTCAIKFEVAARQVRIDRNTFIGNGRSGAYGVHVSGSGSSANGVILNNSFRKARLSHGGVPVSGNTEQ